MRGTFLIKDIFLQVRLATLGCLSLLITSYCLSLFGKIKVQLPLADILFNKAAISKPFISYTDYFPSEEEMADSIVSDEFLEKVDDIYHHADDEHADNTDYDKLLQEGYDEEKENQEIEHNEKNNDIIVAQAIDMLSKQKPVTMKIPTGETETEEYFKLPSKKQTIILPIHDAVVAYHAHEEETQMADLMPQDTPQTKPVEEEGEIPSILLLEGTSPEKVESNKKPVIVAEKKKEDLPVIAENKQKQLNSIPTMSTPKLEQPKLQEKPVTQIAKVETKQKTAEIYEDRKNLTVKIRNEYQNLLYSIEESKRIMRKLNITLDARFAQMENSYLNKVYLGKLGLTKDEAIRKYSKLYYAIMAYHRYKVAFSFIPTPMPIAGGRMSSGFGWRSDPFNKRKKFHKGLDFANKMGTPIRTPASGTVTFAGVKNGYGKSIDIYHGNGIITRYAHLSRIIVKKGQKVNQFTQIGNLGSTGRSTGPHLHYEIFVHGKVANPKNFILLNTDVSNVLANKGKP